MCAFIGMTLTHADHIQFEDIVFWIQNVIDLIHQSFVSYIHTIDTTSKSTSA